jgi:hypothetical protein
MPVNGLLSILEALEVELHHPGVRCSRERLEQLLHPDFQEVGRSGRQYTRETIVRFLASQEHHPRIASERFSVAEPAAGVALLTYRSAHRLPDGNLANHTLRSSLWLLADVGWQLRYHQGTPAAEAW